MKSDDNLKTNNDDKEINDKINNNNNNIEMTTDILNNLDYFDNCENSSRMQMILEEFTKLYTNKISRINDLENKDEEWLKKKTSILESWVEDLGEQNSVLVSTVEQLEKEAKHRVSLLQEKLDKMALVTKESCISMRDHQIQVDTLVVQKIESEDIAQELREKAISLEEANASLLLENSDLKDDLESLIEVITIIRTKGRWDLNRMKFRQIVPAALFGTDFSLSLKDFVQRHSSNCSKSAKLSVSSLGSPGSTDTEEESNPKHRIEEFKIIRKKYKQANALLVERDKHIADLQSQITDLHHQLSVAQTHVDDTTTTLQSLRDKGRFDTMEIYMRDDMIRHLLSPKHTEEQDLVAQTDNEIESNRKADLEMQLSNNIDVLASRLSELEEENRQLKHQNDVLKTAHSHCSPIINQLQEQLITSNKTIEDLRSVLTEEVAERHNQILALRNQLHKTSELHKDALIELQNKNELLQQLKEGVMSEQTENTQLSRKDFTCHGTQTDKMEKMFENEVMNCNSDDRFLSMNVKISKLENELSEKNILLRELQTHLSSSRKELYLKDETLYNIEQKLNLTRRGCDEKEDRMSYLTSQLTSLQLEVSRLHGTVQQLRLQLDSKTNLVKKLETENESLCWQLNEKSSTLEKLQREISSCELEIENRKKEIREQKLTIGTLQDALLSTKQTCDKLRKQYDLETEEHSEHNDKENRLEETNIIQLLKSKLEEAKKEGRIIAEKCNKMERIHENELDNFIDQLIRIQNHRLRSLQQNLYSSSVYRRYPEDSQVVELVTLMEELIRILEDAQRRTSEVKKPRRSYSREPSQYSNYSKNNSKSFKIIKENSFSSIKKDNYKISLDQLSRKSDCINDDDPQRPNKEYNFKGFSNNDDEMNRYNEIGDNQDVVASVRKWLLRQKLHDIKPTENHPEPNEKVVVTPAEKQKSAGRSRSQWKNSGGRNYPTKFYSCESLAIPDKVVELEANRASTLTHLLNKPLEETAQSSSDGQSTRLTNLLQMLDHNSRNSKAFEKNSFGGRDSAGLKTFNERNLNSFDHFLNDIRHPKRPDYSF